jgi:thiamine biosynthesis protein ThiS
MVYVYDRNKSFDVEWEKPISLKDLLISLDYESLSVISVYVNDKYVTNDDFDKFIVEDNSKVSVFRYFDGG